MMKRNKVTEIELALEGREYVHPSYFCCAITLRHTIEGKVVYFTLDGYPDSYAVSCEKHALALIGDGWKER